MYFRRLHDEASGAVSYLLGDLDAGEAVLIDPRGADVPLLGAMLKAHHLRLRWLLRTHEHDDLLAGEAAALNRLGAPCWKVARRWAPASDHRAGPRASTSAGDPPCDCVQAVPPLRPPGRGADLDTIVAGRQGLLCRWANLQVVAGGFGAAAAAFARPAPGRPRYSRSISR